MLRFKREDGSPLREFACVEDSIEHMIKRHNEVVGPKDTCWFLGDIVINRRYLAQISRFNGRLRVVLGNHDIFKNKDYFNAGFEDLHAFRKFDGFVATHIPVHRDSLRTSWGKNVHGHLHSGRVMTKKRDLWGYPRPVIDPDYLCVSMEHLDDYRPISIDEVRIKLEEQAW